MARKKNVVSWHVLCRYELHERRALEWTAEIPSQYFDRSRFLRIEIAARARPARSSRPEVSVKSGPQSWEQFMQDRVAPFAGGFRRLSLEKLAMCQRCQRCLPEVLCRGDANTRYQCIVYAFHGRDSEETRCHTYLYIQVEGRRGIPACGVTILQHSLNGGPQLACGMVALH